MSDQRALLQDVVADPAAAGPKDLYADWLEDHGQPDLAYAYRWAARRGKHPRADGLGYIWGSAPAGSSGEHWQLPFRVYREHSPLGQLTILNSIAQAFEALAVALRRLLDDVQLTPPG